MILMLKLVQFYHWMLFARGYTFDNGDYVLNGGRGNGDNTWKEYDTQKYSDYSRSKIRVLRASVINMPLITLSAVWYILKYTETFYILIIYVLILGIFFTYISWKSYNLSLKQYYDKARALETSKKV